MDVDHAVCLPENVPSFKLKLLIKTYSTMKFLLGQSKII